MFNGLGDGPREAAGLGEATREYAAKGFRYDFVGDFCGDGEGPLDTPPFIGFGLVAREMLSPPLESGGSGLAALLAGWKLSSRTWTKFEGKRPTMRLSLRNRPIHQDPSPAFRHSIRSPSMKPRSRLVCVEIRISHIFHRGRSR